MRIKVNWRDQVLVPTALVYDKRVKGAIKLFIALFGMREEDQPITRKAIAEKLGCGISTIKKFEKNLVDTGWADIERDERGIVKSITLNMRY